MCSAGLCRKTYVFKNVYGNANEQMRWLMFSTGLLLVFFTYDFISAAQVVVGKPLNKIVFHNVVAGVCRNICVFKSVFQVVIGIPMENIGSRVFRECVLTNL